MRSLVLVAGEKGINEMFRRALLWSLRSDTQSVEEHFVTGDMVCSQQSAAEHSFLSSPLHVQLTARAIERA